jgi:hypothetical protein
MISLLGFPAAVAGKAATRAVVIALAADPGVAAVNAADDPAVAADPVVVVSKEPVGIVVDDVKTAVASEPVAGEAATFLGLVAVNNAGESAVAALKAASVFPFLVLGN